MCPSREVAIVAQYCIEVREYEPPELGPNDLRIASILSGISHGTEMAKYRGTFPPIDKRFDTGLRMFVECEARNLAEKCGGIGGDWGGRWNQGLGPFCGRGALAHDELSVGSA